MNGTRENLPDPGKGRNLSQVTFLIGLFQCLTSAFSLCYSVKRVRNVHTLNDFGKDGCTMMMLYHEILRTSRIGGDFLRQGSSASADHN